MERIDRAVVGALFGGGGAEGHRETEWCHVDAYMFYSEISGSNIRELELSLIVLFLFAKNVADIFAQFDFKLFLAHFNTLLGFTAPGLVGLV